MMSQTKNIDADRVTSVQNQDGLFPALIVCEHASNHIPDEYDNLGLAEALRQSHIAWDPGAAEVADHLSRLLNAPYIQCKVSRLVYDCNRPPEAPGAVPSSSEVFEVPGNCGLSEAERHERTEKIYDPFRRSLERVLSGFSHLPALITIHSFTPVYHGEARAVELGILHDRDARLADAMLAAAPAITTLETRRNEPYGPEDGVTHTLQKHGIANNIPNVMIEIRNDLISTPEECEKMAALLYGLTIRSLVEIGHIDSEVAREKAS